MRTTMTYDDGGARSRIIDPRGKRVNMTYDTRPRPAKTQPHEAEADGPFIVPPKQAGDDAK